MNNYELMVIISPDLGKDGVDSLIEEIEEYLNDQGASDLKVDRWGKREIAYEMKGYKEGVYAVFKFKADEAAAADVPRKLDLEEDLIRYMLTRRDR